MVEVLVKDNGMSAQLKITPEEGEIIDVDYLKKMLQLEGVQAGIKTAVLSEIVEKKIYGRFVTVANGKQAVDGEDGFYEYFFVISGNTKTPRVRPDGSVDYSMAITNVDQDDFLAEYHPKTNGVFGYNVFATVLPPKVGKDLRQLRCRNVRLEENKYYADKAGFVTLKDNLLVIMDVLDINGDLDQNVGNLNFNGDIRVHGSILSGLTINATGSIIVDGVIESSMVTAQKDVIVAKGIHGKGKGRVTAQGDVCSTFLNHSYVVTGGDVKIDYSVGSIIEAKGMVKAEGHYGSIVGGMVSAAGGVEAGVFGNNVEIPTRINAGINAAMKKEIEDIKLRINKLKIESEKIEMDSDFENIMELIEELRGDMAELEKQQLECKAAPVIVHKRVYRGVKCFLSEIPAPNLPDVMDIEIRNIKNVTEYREIGTFTEMEINAEIPQEPEEVKEKPRILAVDDDPKILHMVNEMLRDSYHVSVARGGKSARKFLESKRANLILLDYMMPEENGAQVLKSLREKEEIKNIPVVFLTALEDKKKIMECLALKPAGYITKPVDSKTLHDKLRAVLSI